MALLHVVLLSALFAGLLGDDDPNPSTGHRLRGLKSCRPQQPATTTVPPPVMAGEHNLSAALSPAAGPLDGEVSARVRPAVPVPHSFRWGVLPPDEGWLSAGREEPPPSAQQLGSWVTPASLDSLQEQLVTNSGPLSSSGIYKIPGGVIAELSSPDYPEKYHDYVYTTWKFTTDMVGDALRMDCDVLDLGHGDNLTVTPAGETSQIFDRNAGFLKVHAVDEMQVEFRSDAGEGGRLHCSVTNEYQRNFLSTRKVDINSPMCGRTTFASRRIVGGTKARRNAFPWLVAIMTSRRKRFFCGGSIINERYVLTAAHCVAGRTAGGLLISIGKQRLNRDPNETLISVRRIKVHPRYNFRTLDNDIALLQLSQSLRPLMVSGRGRVRPVCLPTARCRSEASCLTGRPGLVAGWGRAGTGKRLSSQVTFIRPPVLDNRQCERIYDARLGIDITRRMICAGRLRGGEGECNGDSGGPLVVLEDGAYVLAGVVSFGVVPCARRGYPGVYVRVSEFETWIRRNSRI